MAEINELKDEELEEVAGGKKHKKEEEKHPERKHYCHDGRCSMYNVYQDSNNGGRCRACGQMMHEFKNE